MRAFFLLFLTLVVQSHVEGSNSSSSSSSYENADLVVSFWHGNEHSQLEAFSSVDNKEIFQQSRDSSALTWFSFGWPRLIPHQRSSSSATATATADLFHMSLEGFSVKVELLNDEMRHLLAARASKKYQVPVDREQILTLTPKSVECQTSLTDEFGQVAIIYGSALALNRFPLRVDFEAVAGSRKRKAFQTTPELRLDCQFRLPSETNLGESFWRLNESWRVVDKLFADDSEFVYVTRAQVDQLASEVYSEESRVINERFLDSFHSSLMKQTGEIDQELHMPLSEQKLFSSLSRYKIGKELSLKNFRFELDSLFEIEVRNGKQRIVGNLKHFRAVFRTPSREFMNFVGGASVETAVSLFADSSAANEPRYARSIEEQLNELNDLTEGVFTWAIESDRVAVRSVRVAKLMRSGFSKPLIFEHSKRFREEAADVKYVSLYARRNVTSHDQPTLVKPSELEARLRELDSERGQMRLELMQLGARVGVIEKSCCQETSRTQNFQNPEINAYVEAMIPAAMSSPSDSKPIKLEETRPNWTANKTLTGHASNVYALEMSSNGRNLISGSWDKTIKIWDLDRGKCLQTLAGHKGGIRALVVDTKSSQLVSASADLTIKVWDLTSGQCLRTLLGHAKWVYALAIGLEGELTSGSMAEMKVWDLSSGKCLRTITGHAGWIYALAIGLEGQLISGSYDRTIKVWNLKSGQCLLTLAGHSGYVYAVAVSREGLVVSGSADETVKVWSLTSGACVRTLMGHTSTVYALAFSGDGSLVSGSSDGAIKVWSLTSGVCLRTLDAHSASVYSLVVSKEGLIMSGSLPEIKVWKLA